MCADFNSSAGSVPDRYYFLHIPKTAGTTFNAILQQQFRPEEVCPTHHLHEFVRYAPECLEKFRLFRGHLYYGIEVFLPWRPIYLTFLREPVARFISNYKHIRATPGHFLNRTSTLSEFLADEEACRRSANFQTRSLGLRLTPGPKTRYEPADVPTLDLLERAMEERLSSEELLQLAKERLHEMAFIGITERFAESMALLQATFHWRVPETIERLNVNSRKAEEIPRECLEKIRELNILDLQLYEHALGLFAALKAKGI